MVAVFQFHKTSFRLSVITPRTLFSVPLHLHPLFSPPLLLPPPLLCKDKALSISIASLDICLRWVHVYGMRSLFLVLLETDKRKGGTDYDYTIAIAHLFEFVNLDFWKRMNPFLLVA